MNFPTVLFRPCKQLSCYTYMASVHQVRYNSNRAILRRPKGIFTRQYPTRLVLNDGSTISVRFPFPRRIIQLPLDLSKVSEEERIARLQRREPKQKIKVQKELEDDFDARQYRKMWKKK